MSLIVSGYPEPRYHGETGEVSATFKPVTDPPDYAPDGGNVQYHYLATQQSTAGDYGLYRIDAGPVKGFGAATHFHKAMSEAFFVLSGTWRLYNGENWPTPRRATFCLYRRAAYTPSKTIRVQRLPCSCCLRREHPDRNTSKASVHSPT